MGYHNKIEIRTSICYVLLLAGIEPAIPDRKLLPKQPRLPFRHTSMGDPGVSAAGSLFCICRLSTNRIAPVEVYAEQTRYSEER